MKNVDMSILSEKRKLSMAESLDLVEKLTSSHVVSRPVALSLVGLQEQKEFFPKTQVDKEKEDILFQYNKDIETNKNNNLPAPKMPNIFVDKYRTVLKTSPYARNHKEDFLPKLELIPIFNKLVEDLSNYPVNMIQLRKKDNEYALSLSCDPLYKHQSLIGKHWREVQIDYQLASNNVIFLEFLKDSAMVIATAIEYRKFVNLKGKQCDQRIRDWYNEVFSTFNHKLSKQEWFSIVLEDLLSLAAGFEPKHQSGVPCDLTEWRIFFSKSFDASTKSIKQILK